MTLGCHLGPDERGRIAMVFEAGDGSLFRQACADVARESTNLAAGLRRRGCDKGDWIAILTCQHPRTAVVQMAVFWLARWP
ncbi:MAG: long-chain fatty acid--CoA ligase [Boseongicola sp. SB0673_bin_14]|nr:long-chain fatty acid--CoA ligase [Boseongicola sp. SB0673_bin_14]